MTKSLQTLDDRALWERACRGDEDAWQELGDRFGPGMAALLFGRTEPGAVRGVLEEIFGKARGELQRIPEPSAVGRWLLEQARTHPVGRSGSAGGDLGRMLGHVAKLDEDAREAVLLEAAAGLDADGIADLLHIRRSEIEARLERGHERLGKAVEAAALARAIAPYRYKAKRKRKNPIPLILALLVGGLAVGAFFLITNLPDDAEGWRVAWTSGAKGQDYLDVGGRVETSDEQRARLTVDELGYVDVGPDSLVQRETAEGDSEQLRLVRGALGIELTGGGLIVTTPSAAVHGEGSFVVEADGDGRGLVRATNEMVVVVGTNGKGFASVVPQGASCRLLPGEGPGVPSFDDGPAELQGVTPEGAVSAALMATTPRDTLVLWHLLGRIETGDRELLVAKLEELVPLPEGVTARNVAGGDPAAMKAYGDELGKHWK